VGKVTDMGYMFYGASSFNQDISPWDGKQYIDMLLVVLVSVAAVTVSYRPA
jgi:hypothetical protein